MQEEGRCIPWDTGQVGGIMNVMFKESAGCWIRLELEDDVKTT